MIRTYILKSGESVQYDLNDYDIPKNNREFFRKYGLNSCPKLNDEKREIINKTKDNLKYYDSKMVFEMAFILYGLKTTPYYVYQYLKDVKTRNCLD